MLLMLLIFTLYQFYSIFLEKDTYIYPLLNINKIEIGGEFPANAN